MYILIFFFFYFTSLVPNKLNNKGHYSVFAVAYLQLYNEKNKENNVGNQHILQKLQIL